MKIRKNKIVHDNRMFHVGDIVEITHYYGKFSKRNGRKLIPAPSGSAGMVTGARHIAYKQIAAEEGLEFEQEPCLMVVINASQIPLAVPFKYAYLKKGAWEQFKSWHTCSAEASKVEKECYQKYGPYPRDSRGRFI